MKDDKKILLDFKMVTRKKKKIIRMKNNKKFKKFRKKKTLNLNLYMKRMLILIFIIITIVIFIFSLLMIKKKIKKKLNIENISYIFNYSLKYEEFDENINEQYMQLQNKFCEKQNEGLIQEYEDRLKKTYINFHGKQFEMFVYKTNDTVSKGIIN